MLEFRNAIQTALRGDRLHPVEVALTDAEIALRNIAKAIGLTTAAPVIPGEWTPATLAGFEPYRP